MSLAGYTPNAIAPAAPPQLLPFIYCPPQVKELYQRHCITDLEGGGSGGTSGGASRGGGASDVAAGDVASEAARQREHLVCRRRLGWGTAGLDGCWLLL